jgi:hypothetical protein
VRCILLDTNNADQDPEKWHGRVERPAMEWLEAELDQLDRETPVLLFTHQGLVGNREELECDVENAEQVLALLAEYNLLAGFAAHAHRLRLISAGEADFFVCPALSTTKGNKGGEPPGILIVDVFQDEAKGSLRIIPEDPNPRSPSPQSSLRKPR